MRGDTAKFPVCFAEEIGRDVASIRRCVAERLVDVGYALLLDEGGYWRTRQTPPQGDCRLWGSDSERRRAPAMFVTRIAAEGV